MNDIGTNLNRKGYVVIHNFFSPREIHHLLECIIGLAESIYRREFNDRRIPGKTCVEKLDRYVMELFEKDKGLVGELYDAFAYSTAFLRLVARPDITSMINTMCGEDIAAPLYAYTNRCRIDPPHDTRRTYGWHQEIFYTIPKGRFLQTWAPLFRNTTIENGTIEIAEGSNFSGKAQQMWSEESGKALQVTIDQKFIDRHKIVQLEMNVGDLLVFTGYTAHRSGYNSSNAPRYSLVGMYHSGTNSEVHWPQPDFKMRGMTPKEYFEQHKKFEWQ